MFQENQLRYPTIFVLAIDVIPIQGSAVPCERVFSSAKETMAARRSRISPELMKALQVLKFSIQKGHSLNFTAGTSRSAELSELEGLNMEEASIPEDIMAFIASLDVSEDFL
jgi:hAT family C-terminal dimerisation region